MDCRCPICSHDLGRRKLGHAIVARMEIECSFCKNYIQLNVHRAEHITVLASFVGFLALAAISWLLQSQALALVAFGSAMILSDIFDDDDNNKHQLLQRVKSTSL